MTQIGRMVWSAQFMACAFYQLGQYTSSPGRKGYCYTQNSPFSSLAVVVTIASTHCAYPRRDGRAELAWVAGCEWLRNETDSLPARNKPIELANVNHLL